MNSEHYLKTDETEKKELKILRTAFDKAKQEHQEVLAEYQTAEKDTIVDSTNLKLEINEIVWRNCAEKTTLAEAENIASDFWTAIMATHN